jgi:membrane-associated protease RseP (regulator of RpoE activity)
VRVAMAIDGLVSVGWSGGRLGIAIRQPGAELIDQLDLPPGQGLLITDVQADSPAAKAGLKVNDILITFNGQPVPSALSDLRSLLKTIAGIKANTPVDAIVLRKGKKEPIKGIVLPEVKDLVTPVPATANLRVYPPDGQIGFTPAPVPLAKPGGAQTGQTVAMAGAMSSGAGSMMVTMFRTGTHFTTRHQEGNLVITLSGAMAEGKSKLNEIHVQDGNASHNYKSVDEVPERYRDKVNNLLEMSNSSNAKIEIKAPNIKAIIEH